MVATMTTPNRPWYKNNRQLVALLPFLVIGLGVAQSGLTGATRNVAQAVLGAALLGFVVLVGRNARRGARPQG
ncbi:MAG TPA: hypothetical protein VFS29_04405 [Motilibacteraceae bacterium]|nr:hypothetical protein [Motilibacteraceae bacterium]